MFWKKLFFVGNKTNVIVIATKRAMNNVSHRVDSFLDALHKSHESQSQIQGTIPVSHIGGRQERHSRSRRLRRYSPRRMTRKTRTNTHPQLRKVSDLEHKMNTYIATCMCRPKTNTRTKRK